MTVMRRTSTDESLLSDPALDVPGSDEPLRPDMPVSLLLVDDNEANLIALRAILDPLREHIVTASSGEEALRAVLRQDFAVILMDVQMPGLDGFETAALIKSRSRSRHVPILFLTAINRDSHHVFRGYAHGAVDYLVKPFDPEVLRSKVAVFVDLCRKERLVQVQAEQLRKRDLDALAARNEARYHALMDALPHGVWAVTRTGVIHYANRAALEFDARGAHEAKGAFAALVHRDDRTEAIATWIHVLRSGKEAERQCRLRLRDGSFRWHLARVAPEVETDGTIVGWIVTATDIDDQKRGETARAALLEQEREARREAEEARTEAVVANRTKDEFLATVSHELRTPLTAILGWAHVLRSAGMDAARTSRAIETIERNALVQAQLIDDILDVSRIVAGKLRVERRPIPLAPVADAAVDAVRPGADTKGVLLEVNVDRSLWVDGDGDRLQQVIWNLLSNAIKFTPKGGTVSLGVAREGDLAVVSVHDTGEGIAADFLPHVFERFRQADASSTRSHGGLGLGLAIVRHLVESHDGKVTVASEGSGRGAAFFVRIPAIAPIAPENHLPKEHRTTVVDTPRVVLERDRPMNLAGVRVLLMDTTEESRVALAEVLTMGGASVTIVCSLDEAMAQLDRTLPDVMVMDFATCTEVERAMTKRMRDGQERRPRVPTIALCSAPRRADEAPAPCSGFDEWLPKPVEPDALVTAIARLAMPDANNRRASRDDEKAQKVPGPQGDP